MLNVINTPKDLNAFIMFAGISDPNHIISQLADKKLIVSFEMMKLITEKVRSHRKLA